VSLNLLLRLLEMLATVAAVRAGAKGKADAKARSAVKMFACKKTRVGSLLGSMREEEGRAGEEETS